MKRSGKQSNRKLWKKKKRSNSGGFNYGIWKAAGNYRGRIKCTEDDITPETTFVDDLGADSLDIFQIIMGIEEEFDIEIDNEEAEKITTVQDAVEQIKKAVE